MFNTGLIDSLKMRIKLTDVKVLDKRLVTDYIAYYPTLEAVDDDGVINDVFGHYSKAQPFVKILNGITYRFFIKAFITPKKTSEEYLVLQVSAKMLKQRYFEGITKSNYKLILDDINAFGIINISEQIFLQALVSDIDICINQLINIDSLKSAFSLIREFPAKGKLPLIHFISRSNNQSLNNFGVDFNKREKATNTSPYCKIYHKGYELLSKSLTFYNTYLSPLKASFLDNLVRYEFTIKAKQHKDFLIKKGFNADIKTFKDLIFIPSKDLTAIAKSGIRYYVDPPTQSKANKELSPTDIQIQSLMSIIINMGGEEDKLFQYLYSIDCPVTKSRSKTKTKKLLDDMKNRNENLKRKLETNNESYQFLANLGL